jgi:hypothetical protein
MISLPRAKTILFLCCLMFGMACKKQKLPEPIRGSVKGDSWVLDVWPLANGMALVSRLNEEGNMVPVLLLGDQLVKVTGLPKGADFLEAYPLADGSAYVSLSVVEGPSLFHLQGHQLVPVAEVAQFTNTPGTASAAGYAWAQRGAVLAKKAKEERDNAAAEEAIRDANR